MNPTMQPEEQARYPDFSDGEAFLGTLRGGLRRRQRRRALVAGAASAVSAVLLFVFSFSSIQRQIDEGLWEQYLLSDMEYMIDTEAVDEFTWELYLESLLEEDDLDILLEELFRLEDGEDWVQTINVKG